jgi:hypothetical protein
MQRTSRFVTFHRAQTVAKFLFFTPAGAAGAIARGERRGALALSSFIEIRNIYQSEK